MSDTDRTNHPIPGGPIKGFAHIQVSSIMRDIFSCADVEAEAGELRLHLGDLALSFPVETWRPIIAALNAALVEVDGTQQVSIPDTLGALMAAIEDAEALDGAL